jgi:putative membrane protein
VAFAAEYSSTRNGFPFGLYAYTGATRGQELYVSNVPFMDSLSFSFLAYASFALAQVLLLQPEAGDLEIARLRRTPATLLLAAVLFMLIDVIIDPVALRGDRWFLGKIYEYPRPGIYFGVPLSNFLGWGLVGLTVVWLFQRADRAMPQEGAVARDARPLLAGAGLYYLILGFSLSVTVAIGEYGMALAGAALYAPVTWLFVRQCWRLSSVQDLARRGAIRT